MGRVFSCGYRIKCQLGNMAKGLVIHLELLPF